jgi:hypothetical protein
MNEGISVADALALRNTGSDNCNNGWGGDGWWIIIFIILAMGGWGRGGFGGGFGGGNEGGYSPCCVPATAQGVSDAFNFNQLDNGLRGIQNGLCDGFYAQNNAINGVLSAIQNCCCQTQLGMTQGFHGVDSAICNLGYNIQAGFNGVDKSICTLGYNNQAGFNALATQLASCCCDLGRGQENIKYEMANNTNALLVAGDKNTDRIINYLTQTEMDKLRTELQSAQFQLSQLSQTSNIVNQLMPVAKPAYLTCSPYAAAFGFGANYGFANAGCGCNPCNTCC